MKIVGVDPGKDMGIVLVDGDTLDIYHDIDALSPRKLRLESPLNAAILEATKCVRHFLMRVQMVPRVSSEQFIFAIEIPYVGRGKQAAIKQAQMVGALKHVALGCCFEIIDVAPKQAKLALTGRGDSPKSVMLRRAMDMYPEVEWNHTLADALGIALAGLKKKLNE